MKKSLRIKLAFLMLIFILLIMIVVCAFLIRGVQSFYTNEFYMQMQEAFANEEMVAALRSAADSSSGAVGMADILSAYSGQLGVDTGTRNYYILDAKTGAYIMGSDPLVKEVEVTKNILTAMAGGEGYGNSSSSKYMDVALPITGSSGNFIIYLRDNKQAVQDLNRELFSIIIEAIVVGFAIAIALGIILSNTLLQPIRSMTKAAEKMSEGDFSSMIAVESEDELGVLANTFNNMASQLEETLEEIKKSEILRREFVANVSHELRTPITSVRSYAETLVDSDNMTSQMREDFLRVIMTESDRMAKIVRDLLELSRFDAGSMTFDFKELSLEQSVRDIYNAIALEAKKHNQTVNLELEWGLPQITGDKDRIEQVILNIMSNAVKYTPDGGTIDVFSGRKGKYLWIKVQDSGIGIPEEDLPRVFDRFYRVDKARSRDYGGTGLGLSIANEIVMRHNGKIEIESSPGEGTTVTVYFPIEGAGDEG